jgi:hypothetical protein
MNIVFSRLCFIEFDPQHFSSIHPLYRKIYTLLINLTYTKKKVCLAETLTELFVFRVAREGKEATWQTYQ